MKIIFSLFYLLFNKNHLGFEVGISNQIKRHNNYTRLNKKGDSALIPLKDISKHFPPDLKH